VIEAGALDASPFEAGPIAMFVDAGASSCLAVDPAHDNAVPDAAVASPLQPAWTASFGGQVSYPVLAGTSVVIAASEVEADVQAFDLETGARLWGPVDFGSFPLLAAEGNTIVAEETAGNLSALDAADGHILWNVQLPGESAYWYAPVAFGGIVYVAGSAEGTATFAIDESTGRTLWTAHPSSGGNIAVGTSAIYEDDGCQTLYAIDALDGAIGWFHQGSCAGQGSAVPSAYDDLIWVRDPLVRMTDGLILDSSGEVQGTFSATDTPALHGGTAFYVSPEVTAVDIQSQTVRWSFAGDGTLCTAAVVAGGAGQVFVAGSSGNVYELDEATGTQRSVHHLASATICAGDGSEKPALGLARDHLLVPAFNELVVY
jgi:outer membrane protein assembly factor BamB